MRTIRQLSKKSSDSTQAEPTSYPSLNPLYRKKIRSQFVGWVFIVPSGLTLFAIVDPLVDFLTGVKIVLLVGLYSYGVKSFALAGLFEDELRKEKRIAKVLAQDSDPNWIEE